MSASSSSTDITKNSTRGRSASTMTDAISGGSRKLVRGWQDGKNLARGWRPPNRVLLRSPLDATISASDSTNTCTIAVSTSKPESNSLSQSVYTNDFFRNA